MKDKPDNTKVTLANTLQQVNKRYMGVTLYKLNIYFKWYFGKIAAD